LSTTRARRDAAVGLAILAVYAALLVSDRVGSFFPFLLPLEGVTAYGDELFLGIVVTTALGFGWAYRRGGELRTALAELAASRQLAEMGFESSPFAMCVLDLETRRFLAVNEACLRQYGYTRDEFLHQMSGPDLSPPARHDEAVARLARLSEGAPTHSTTQHVRRDGSLLWVDVTHGPVEFMGRPASIAVAIDVTAREEMAAQRRVAEARYRAVFDNDAAGIIEVDPSGRLLAVNDCFARMVGRPREEVETLTLADITHPDDRSESNVLLATLASGRTPTYSVVKRYVRPDGGSVWATVAVARVPGVGDASPRNIAVAIDVTSLRRAEEEREQLHQRLSLALDATDEALWDWDLATDACYYSPAFGRLLGLAPEDVPPHISCWTLRIHPDDAPRVTLAVNAHIAGETSGFEMEYRLVRADGSLVWVLDRGRVVQRDAAGRALRMVGTLADVSERRSLEEQLRQAQKMEAVGQLAGGVAHDFNNLLTVIRTGLELALAENLSDETRADLSEVEMATERATNLTSQLLAFSRRRLAQPRLISLNDAVDELARLLSRVLTEDIEVRRRLLSRARVMADPGHVGQALLNIAVNARDAMPSGGVLTLATHDEVIAPHAPETHEGIAPGSYCVVTIGDTGQGMPPDVRARIFEPFFTTKPLGKGTGLGLASVYGVVKQVDGAVRVESAVGVGTKFFLYFPVATDPAASEGAARPDGAPGGHEEVLIVEDDAAVRTVAARVLGSHGYRVRQASDGAQAAAMLRETPGIACVVSDVVMPVMPGSVLAAHMRERHPDVALVLMSAHSHDVLTQFPLPAGTDILAKPFSSQSLLRAVRAAIDAKGPTA